MILKPDEEFSPLTSPTFSSRLYHIFGLIALCKSFIPQVLVLEVDHKYNNFLLLPV